MDMQEDRFTEIRFLFIDGKPLDEPLGKVGGRTGRALSRGVSALQIGTGLLTSSAFSIHDEEDDESSFLATPPLQSFGLAIAFPKADATDLANAPANYPDGGVYLPDADGEVRKFQWSQRGKRDASGALYYDFDFHSFLRVELVVATSKFDVLTASGGLVTPILAPDPNEFGVATGQDARFWRVSFHGTSKARVTIATEQTVTAENLNDLERAVTPEVKAILVESPANPLMTVTDLAGVAEIAKRHHILSIVDNTFMTPYLQRPLTLGADIVLHSGTKYLGGHSDVVAGLVAVKDPQIAARLAFIQNATGGVLGPQDSFLIIRGIKTLAVRMDRHVENAEKAARFLKEHHAVSKVYYPGLPDAQGYDINLRQAKNGGAMISFELDDRHDYRVFVSALKLIALAESLGGVESLVCHPATMTHASIPKEIREKVGITDSLIRLSIGIEHIDDLLADLEQAIKASAR